MKGRCKISPGKICPDKIRVCVATGTIGYKHRSAGLDAVRAALIQPNFPLKIIPHVDGTPRICELVVYFLEDVVVEGPWTGLAALSLNPHALAPVAELPVLEVVSALHLVADLRRGRGRVAHDYLARGSGRFHTHAHGAAAQHRVAEQDRAAFPVRVHIAQDDHRLVEIDA